MQGWHSAKRPSMGPAPWRSLFFAECPIKDTRQRGLCRSIFCHVLFAKCRTRQRTWIQSCKLAADSNTVGHPGADRFLVGYPRADRILYLQFSQFRCYICNYLFNFFLIISPWRNPLLGTVALTTFLLFFTKFLIASLLLWDIIRCFWMQLQEVTESARC